MCCIVHIYTLFVLRVVHGWQCVICVKTDTQRIIVYCSGDEWKATDDLNHIYMYILFDGIIFNLKSTDESSCLVIDSHILYCTPYLAWKLSLFVERSVCVYLR